jgi:spore cortex biosynthesis protein YabQ
MRKSKAAAAFGPGCLNSMESPITQQMAQAAASLITGAGLGIFYDLLRAFRRRCKAFVVTLALDVVFWIGAALVLFTLGLGPGNGELRIFMLIFVLGGAVLYFLGLSEVVLQILGKIDGFIAKMFEIFFSPLKAFEDKLKKGQQKFKNVFQKSKKWFTIKVNTLLARQTNDKSGFYGAREGSYEAKTGGIFYEGCYTGAHSLRRDQLGHAERPAFPRPGNKRSAPRRRKRKSPNKR